MIKSMRVIAVNKPHGTMTVQWNNDPELEWNYTIPLDDKDAPLEGSAFLRHMVSTAYENVSLIIEQRELDAKRNLINFNHLNSLRGQRFDMEALVNEYEQALGLTG